MVVDFHHNGTSCNEYADTSGNGLQPLFSRDEILVGEPQENSGHNAKGKPSSLSPFERALGNKQVPKKELVGAGRKATSPKGKAITVVASTMCPFVGFSSC